MGDVEARTSVTVQQPEAVKIDVVICTCAEKLECDQSGAANGPVTRTIATQASEPLSRSTEARVYRLLGLKRNGSYITKGELLRPDENDVNGEEKRSHSNGEEKGHDDTGSSLVEDPATKSKQRFSLSKTQSCPSIGRLQRSRSKQLTSKAAADQIDTANTSGDKFMYTNLTSSNKENEGERVRRRYYDIKGEKKRLQCPRGHGLQWVANNDAIRHTCSYCHMATTCDNFHTCTLCLQDEGVQVVVCEKCSRHCFEPQPLSSYIPPSEEKSTLTREVSCEEWLAVTDARASG